MEKATPVDELLRLIAASAEVFATVVEDTVPRLADGRELAAPGVVHRFED
jgi:hypothetical protein